MKEVVEITEWASLFATNTSTHLKKKEERPKEVEEDEVRDTATSGNSVF